jgi:Tfp pilus assembly protein FimT
MAEALNPSCFNNGGTAMRIRNNQRGQGMTEYIIVVALVAIAAIGVYTAFGKTVRGQMAVTAQALAGNAADQARSEANTGGQDATTQAQRSVQLDNFDQSR